jgi:hypothetical protein
MKFKIIIGAVTIVIVILVSTFYFLTKNEELQYNAEIMVKDCGDNYQVAAEMLMERYLTYYRSPLVGISQLLTDYKIMKINAYDYTNGSESIRNQKDKYEFRVNYSVKMFSDNNWIAGNGVVGKDGWVNNKIGFGYFHKSNNKYILDGIGTGP